MKKYIPVAFLLLISFVACQKEYQPDPQNPIADDSCRISRSYYYGGGGVNDSMDYVYEAGRLTKLVGADYEVKYFYSGNNIHHMEYYSMPAGDLYRIDTFEFANNLLMKIRTHDHDLYWNTDSVYTELNFVYNGNKLTRVVRADQWLYDPTVIDTIYSDFTYTGDNITALHFSDRDGILDSVYYDYDNELNYFNPVSDKFFLADPFFSIHVGFEPHLPYFLSRNNVINFTIYDNIDYPVSYVVDSARRPVLVSQGGFDYMGYKYECP